MRRALHWAREHRHVVALKVAVAAALVAHHYMPNSKFGLLVNLIWLALF